MTHINQRRDTAANWTATNPVLQLGEVGWERDTRKSKQGDGTTAWNSLPYSTEPLDNATLTGTPTAPTAAPGTNTTQVATTQFVVANGASKADLNSPVFTGDPKAPTPSTADNDTSIATTAFVKAQGYAPTASPTFTGDPKAPTPATSDSDTSLATTAFVKAALLAAHPVGDIKMTTVNTNPSTYLGGTWVAWGSGRVPVGVDTGQTEFNTVEKTGGAKTHTLAIGEIPSHDHGGSTGSSGEINFGTSLSIAGSNPAGTARAARGGGTTPGTNTLDSSSHTHSVASQGGGGAHNNLQPYITCYMWKRTA